MEQYKFFLGVDWGTQTHALCLQIRGGGKARHQQFEHNPRCLGQMIEWIEKQIAGGWRQLAVAIERPHGLVVQLLLARQAGVFAINPKKLDRFRERYNVAGAKDDRLDAAVLADTLQKDAYAYHQVFIRQPDELMIRELTHTLEDVQQDLGRYCNRLWDALNSFYPAPLQLAGGADEPWLWELLEQAPTPAQGAALTVAQLGALLKRHRIRRIRPEQLQACLSQTLALAAGCAEALAVRLSSLLRIIKELAAEAARLEEQITAQMERLARAEAAARPQPDAPTDYEIIDSLPGFGPKTKAVLYSEALEPLRRRNYAQLRAWAGAAAVTERSGKHCAVLMRHACNGRLRQAMHHAANGAWQAVEYWGKMYAAMRQRGLSHGRALRGLVDRILKVLIALLRHRRLFDADKLGRMRTGH